MSGASTIEVDGTKYEYDTEKPYRDGDLLEDLYWEEGMDQREIADVIGCSSSSVARWMSKKDITTRMRGGRRPPWFGQASNGYEMWTTEIDGDTHHVYVHRLLAIAEYGFENVCGEDVHHKNSVKWDNRHQNIELKAPSEHRQDHSLEREGDGDIPWRDKEQLYEMYCSNGMSTYEIADEWGCAHKTVYDWLDKHGIETRSRGPKPSKQTQDDQQTLVESAE